LYVKESVIALKKLYKNDLYFIPERVKKNIFVSTCGYYDVFVDFIGVWLWREQTGNLAKPISMYWH
jgi:hypothetical protein